MFSKAYTTLCSAGARPLEKISDLGETKGKYSKVEPLLWLSFLVTHRTGTCQRLDRYFFLPRMKDFLRFYLFFVLGEELLASHTILIVQMFHRTMEQFVWKRSAVLWLNLCFMYLCIWNKKLKTKTYKIKLQRTLIYITERKTETMKASKIDLGRSTNANRRN